jgi:hypothetical protein
VAAEEEEEEAQCMLEVHVSTVYVSTVWYYTYLLQYSVFYRLLEFERC